MNTPRNLNDLAVAISFREGGKRVMNIGDVKEVLRCLGDILQEMKLENGLALIGRLVTKKGKR